MFIVLWDVDDYPGMGGGVDYREVDSEKEVKDLVDKKRVDSRIKEFTIYEIKRELEVFPVKVVEQIEIREKDNGKA